MAYRVLMGLKYPFLLLEGGTRGRCAFDVIWSGNRKTAQEAAEEATAYDADNMTALTTFRADSGDITTDPSERTDGDTTTWAYHPTAGVELSKTYADNSQVVKTYDAFNRLATETNGRGIVKTLSYDAATGLLTQVTDAAGTRSIAYNEYSEQQSDSLDSGAHTHLVTELRDNYGRSTGFTPMSCFYSDSISLRRCCKCKKSARHCCTFVVKVMGSGDSCEAFNRSLRHP